MDPELNYFNYFTEIERFFQTKRRSFTLVSCLDWVVMENWLEQGIPLDVVLKGIERAFSNPNRKRDIGSLAYCVKSVEQVRDEQKDLLVEAPKLPDFQDREVAEFIEKLANDVAPVDSAIAESIRAIGCKDLRAAEQALAALEEKLIALKQAVDRELNPFRSTMTAPQLYMLEQQMWRRKLLERFNVPRLSLFYLI